MHPYTRPASASQRRHSDSPVIEPTQHAGQLGLVAQRQHDGEIQALRRRQRTHWRCLPAGNRGAQMIMQYLERLLRLSGDWMGKPERTGPDQRSGGRLHAFGFAEQPDRHPRRAATMRRISRRYCITKSRMSRLASGPSASLNSKRVSPPLQA